MNPLQQCGKDRFPFALNSHFGVHVIQNRLGQDAESGAAQDNGRCALFLAPCHGFAHLVQQEFRIVHPLVVDIPHGHADRFRVEALNRLRDSSPGILFDEEIQEAYLMAGPLR